MKHSRNGKKFERMNDAQRLEFMATAGRVTIGTTWQVVNDKQLRRFYVAKVRGIIVSDGDTYMFATQDGAREFGRNILDGWKREYYSKAPDKPDNIEAMDFFTEDTEPM